MPFNIICLSPPGFPSAAFASAVLPSGCTGGVAVECGEPMPRGVIDAAAATGRGFALSVSHRTMDPPGSIAPFAGRGMTYLILCDPVPQRLASDVAALREQGVAVLVEVTSAEQAQAAAQADPAGVVIKGNECGGLVGEETAFILLQRVEAVVSLPIWVRGGVGLYTAAACAAAGATGVVLDWQLALCDESELPTDVKARVARSDGSETAILGQDCPLRFRAWFRPGDVAFGELRQLEERLMLDASSAADTRETWRMAVEARVRGDGGAERLFLVGQDAAFAAPLAREFRSVSAICDAIRHEATHRVRQAVADAALRPAGPLAAAHGTRFPILQGPMTRVSDTADFASAVATGGGLPFLALALLRGPQVETLLEETKRKLGDKPWGIGILGFVPKELREEQLAEVRKHPPPFAIIAGGRPDQAAALESQGIHTYLHVPSPGLLSMFLKSGARRVIFEGRECGGHVGPRSSFVLWESMIRVILDHLAETGDRPEDHYVVFAGGIHDAMSASMVAALAAPLSQRGVRIGVLLGTGYLFTKEAVEAGAILKGFQDEAIKCRGTILLETGVGHSTRCADTEFGRVFQAEKRRLIREGRSKDEIREALEMLNLGRLRIASKGITRAEPGSPEASRFLRLDDDAQRQEGMYMIGQVAALRDRVCTIEELHRDVSEGGVARLQQLAPEAPTAGSGKSDQASRPSNVAVIGMSCMFPKAGDRARFWENVLNKVYAIEEIPAGRWDADLYFHNDRRARDKVYSRWGGFLDPVPFDPTTFGMPPNSVPSVEPLQLLVLEAVRHALADAGYGDGSSRPFDREHTSVILGAGGGVGELGLGYGFRSMLAHYLTLADGTELEAQRWIEALEGELPEWTEDSFAGLLLNVAAGRVANRFNLGGTNYTVDAACASSLAAVRLAVSELESGSSNMVIVGGADTMQSPFAYLCFSKTQALSPTGRCRTFDESADGIVISEGVAIAVLKRLEDAERDGDRIYAVIKAVGSSSDGRDKGLTAPRPAGQIRALERAYAKAGVSPATVDMIEAHGTGTVVGDQSEVESLTRTFSEAGAVRQGCALGSVKSMIGHTKCTAGVAGIVKAALALHHKVLPPTIGITTPNPKANFGNSPFYLNTEARPWTRRTDGAPRRAGVSAFGFGGTNFHAVLEEHPPTSGDVASRTAPRREWPAELFVWRGESSDAIVRSIDEITAAIELGAQPVLRDIAAAVCRAAVEAGRHTLAVVAGSIDELVKKLSVARGALARGDADVSDPAGIYYSANPLAARGKIAFVFPGQGSQSVNMLRDLAIARPAVRETFEQADASLDRSLGRPLSGFVFPVPKFADQERAADESALTQTRVAQPAMGAADVAMWRFLSELGLRCDLLAGHSYGEYVALHAAGVLGFEDLIRVSEARGRLLAEAGAAGGAGTMAAVGADEAVVARALEGVEGVWPANFNSPTQTVISGTPAGVEAAMQRLKQQGIAARRIKVSCAFHSPLVQTAVAPFARVLELANWAPVRATVFSNTTAAPHPDDPAAIRSRLLEHLVRPVRFAEEIRAMYDFGARVFVEVGPGRILTGLIEQTLRGQQFQAIATNVPNRDEITQLMHALAQLAAAGTSLDTGKLFDGRTGKTLDVHRLVEQTRPAPLPRTTWMLTGARSSPVDGKPGREPMQSKPKAATAATSAPADRPVARAAAPAVGVTPGEGASATHPAPLPQPSTALLSAAMPGGAPDSVLSAHHQLMTRFLETHRNVMLSCLGQAGAAALPAPMPLATTSGPATASSPPPSPTPLTSMPAAATADVASVPVAPTTIESRPATPLPAAAPAAASRSTPVAVPAAPSADSGPSRDKLAAQLVRVVSDRTGYPPEMLTLDLDLEADLGIDSIKRIEVFGALQDSEMVPARAVTEDMESLSKLKTLRAIVDWLVGQTAVAALEPTSPAAPGEAERPAVSLPAVPRMLLREVVSDLSGTLPLRTIQGIVVITDDEGGVAPALAQELLGKGVAAVVVRVARAGESNGTEPRIDLADPATARDWVGRVRTQQGRVAGIVNLLPMAHDRSAIRGDIADWPPLLNVELLSLFNLVRELESDLRGDGSGFVLSATRMNGAFGSVGDGAGFWPGAGGVCGLVKTLAREWPDATARCVDFEPAADAAFIVQSLATEILARDAEWEVGYRRGRRVVLRPAPIPLGDSDAPVTLDSRSVILITGGARGITAEVGVELAERFGCTLILAGRSQPPSGPEPSETAGISDPRELKQILIRNLERAGEKPAPVKVEAAFHQVMRDREARSYLAAMNKAGARVEYHAVDVTDEAAFRALVDGVYATHGRIDGVIHGAGVIEDKLIRDKTPESFLRVLKPKLAGAFVLATALRPESLQFLVFFSSVSARYGNRGQCDYAAANEVLNKLAIHLNARWKGRVASLMWGPWESSGGMVSAELAKQFAKAGIQLISRAAGRRACVDEILRGRKPDAEVVFGGPLDIALSGHSGAGLAPIPATIGPVTRATQPLLAQLEINRDGENHLKLSRPLDVAQDLYLLDHQLDGKPVMPMAMMVELFAETAMALRPDLQLCCIRDVRVMKGISLDNGPSQVRVHAALRPGANGSAVCELKAFHGSAAQPCYFATGELADEWPPAPPEASLELVNPRPLPMSVEEAYERWLFHGPIFAGVEAVEALGDNGIIARLTGSSPKRCLSEAIEAPWLIDPVIVDSALQLLILWARTYLDMTPLPSRLGCFHRFARPLGGKVRCVTRVRHAPGSPTLHADFRFYDPEGRQVGWLEGMEGTCSKALNRLAGVHVGAAVDPS